MDDWSDSDEEVLDEVETAVLLGIPDGLITAETDSVDAAVSRLGGHPAFLPSKEPPFSSSFCISCQTPMELLVQMWCPFEESPMDRALYVWGCSKADCQYKPGSIRAWRGLRYNQKYAAKLERKLAKQRSKQNQSDLVAPKVPKSNPFSISTAPTSNPFGSGLNAQIFGDSAPPPQQTAKERADDSEASNSDSDSEESLLTAMAAVTVADSPWKTAPIFPPSYLSTVPEYLPPSRKLKAPSKEEVLGDHDDAKDKSKDMSWTSEAYENSLDLDQVFERFCKRVGYEGEQCIRYELGGIPLPFSADSTFDLLFPHPEIPSVTITKSVFTVSNIPKRSYDPSKVPPCPVCGGKRIFECQLMPNLINALRASKKQQNSGKVTDEERRKEVQAALKRGGSGGMEWGTCLVFSCANDCRQEAKDAWREEYVLVQWDLGAD